MGREINGNPGTGNRFIETRIEKVDTYYAEGAHHEVHYHDRQYIGETIHAIQSIWESIVDVELFLSKRINEQINEHVKQNCLQFHIDPQIIEKTYCIIRKKEILLPEPVARAAENIIYYHCDTYNNYLAMINRAAQREVTLEEVNSYIPERLKNDLYLQQKQVLLKSLVR